MPASKLTRANSFRSLLTSTFVARRSEKLQPAFRSRDRRFEHEAGAR